MAADTSLPGGATRYIQTTRGLLSYSQLAPLLAERVLRVERDIARETPRPSKTRDHLDHTLKPPGSCRVCSYYQAALADVWDAGGDDRPL